MKIGTFQLEKLILIFAILTFASCEYVSEDEPRCRSECSTITDVNEKSTCLKTYMEFYSYKLVKSLFNFGKLCVYAGLWNTRYEYAEEELFENIFMQTLRKYNDPKILGNVKFEDLNSTAMQLYDTFKVFTLKKKPGEERVKYESYPSLKCPTPCSYELITWQTLFYVSIAIFVLALITILFYSIFLRRQYVSLRDRVKNSKFNIENNSS